MLKGGMWVNSLRRMDALADGFVRKSEQELSVNPTSCMGSGRTKSDNSQDFKTSVSVYKGAPVRLASLC